MAFELLVRCHVPVTEGRRVASRAEMIANAQNIADLKSSFLTRCPSPRLPGNRFARQFFPASIPPRPAAALRRDTDARNGEVRGMAKRREFLLLPSLAMAAGFLHSVAAAAAAEEKAPEPLPAAASAPTVVDADKGKEKIKEEKEKEEEGEPEILSRVYDATVIGEPQAVGKDKRRVWEKLMGARIVYLGEAEMVPDRDDRVLELEIVKNLRNRCLEQHKTVSVALEAFPIDLQQQLDQFVDGRFVFFLIFLQLGKPVTLSTFCCIVCWN
ncbi:hypothetical protein BHM03_00060089 [Ensete ventricosum]|nr:hypothetical protein BHM03_00060089 [Ensete ventricosum]